MKKVDKYTTKVSRSICKINIKTKTQIIKGTRFLIKLKINNNTSYKYFLMTNENVIEREFIQDENI